ncbi:hypothetical protein D9M71_847460 [compost metagenome]
MLIPYSVPMPLTLALSRRERGKSGWRNTSLKWKPGLPLSLGGEGWGEGLYTSPTNR